MMARIWLYTSSPEAFFGDPVDILPPILEKFKKYTDDMKKLPFVLFLALLFTADFVSAAENEEIDFLLSSIAASNCVFIRNGKEHQAKEASEHLEMKYNYAKSRIKTAEIFINKIASKSSITRKKYLIRCGSVTIPARQWLERALESQRISVERLGINRRKRIE